MIPFFSVFTIIKIICCKQLNIEINRINTLKIKKLKKNRYVDFNFDLTASCKFLGHYNRFLLIAHNRKLYTLPGL